LYQINYASEKKMLQITSRIHIEDLDKAMWNLWTLEAVNANKSIGNKIDIICFFIFQK